MIPAPILSPLAVGSHGFSPDKLPGLAAWYSADQGVLTQVTNAADFIAANSERLSVADNSTLRFGNKDWTIAFWIKPNATANTSFLSKSTNSVFELNVGTNSTQSLYVQIGDGGGTNVINYNAANGSTPTGQWTFVILQFNALTQVASFSFNDGSLSNSSAASSAPGFTANSFTLGSSSHPTGYITGGLALVGKWDRLLTSDERTFLYNTGAGRLYADLPTALRTSLISYWNLTEASGTRNDSHGTNNLTDNNTVGAATGPYASPASDGQTVRRWLDRSGNNRHLDQATLVNQGTLQSGEVTFSAAPTFYTATFSPSLVQPCTIYYACKPTNFSAERYVGFGQSGTLLDIGFSNSSGALRLHSGALLTGASATAGQKSIVCAIFNGSSSVARLGNNSTTGNAGTNSPASTGVVGAVNIGGQNPFLGGISETIVYSSAHSTADQNKVVQYLARKWGITL